MHNSRNISRFQLQCTRYLVPFLLKRFIIATVDGAHITLSSCEVCRNAAQLIAEIPTRMGNLMRLMAQLYVCVSVL